MMREPDCEYCGGKTPADTPPLYYTSCVHDELCTKVWAWRFGAMVAEVSAREFVAKFAEYVKKVKARTLRAAAEQCYAINAGALGVSAIEKGELERLADQIEDRA